MQALADPLSATLSALADPANPIAKLIWAH
jgi:hypothetical protein